MVDCGRNCRGFVALALRWAVVGVVGLAPWTARCATELASPFVVEVVDEATGRGVPMVELKSVNKVSWWTDNAGVAALVEPGWAGREVHLQMASPGYEFPADGLGYRGFKIRYVAGGHQRVRLKRVQVAERMYRLTGEGLFRDSLMAGRKVPWKEGQLNAEVLGQDSVVATPFQGKIWWFWGDTDRLNYPLGHFGSSAATSDWPVAGGGSVDQAFQYRYFTQSDGFAKPVCRLDGKGLRWIESAFVLRDEHGEGEQLYARVTHLKDLGEVWAWHLMRWNAVREEFESIHKWEWKETHDVAHAFRARVENAEWLFLYPNQRVLPRLDSVKRLEEYEAFTCVAGDGRWTGANTPVARDSQGKIVYGWKKGADRLGGDRIRDLVKSGQLKGSESWLPRVDMETGKPWECGRHSVAWNGWLKKWVMIAAGQPGEIWFSAADTPTGPWGYARRVAVHGQYNFYNPVHHAFLNEDGGRILYFEGTYTAAFSGARSKTPRYDYNQILYRLDLRDERLALPVPVYRVSVATGGQRQDEFRRMPESWTAGEQGVGWESVAFWVKDRRGEGDRALVGMPGGALRLETEPMKAKGGRMLGWVPRQVSTSVPHAQLLYGLLSESQPGSGRQVFLEPGADREPVGQVWRNPVDAATWTVGVHP